MELHLVLYKHKEQVFLSDFLLSMLKAGIQNIWRRWNQKGTSVPCVCMRLNVAPFPASLQLTYVTHCVQPRAY